MYYLKQSTASQEVLLGPFVDSTDGVTAETGLTIANTDIKIHVAGATTLASKNSGGATHISNGNYYAVLDATDTATLGSGCIIVQVAGALAVRVDICILAANVYDSLIGGGDILDVSTTQFNGSNVTASSGRPEVNVTHGAGTAWNSGAIGAATLASNTLALSKIATDTRNAFGFTTTGTLSGTHSDTTADLGASAPSSDITGQTLYFSDHDLSRLVTDYDTGTGIATFDSIGVTLANGNTWYRYPTAPSSGGSGLDAAGVRTAIGLASANLDTQLAALPTAAENADAVWDEATTGHTTSGTFGEQVKTDIDAILVDTGTTLDGRIPAALVNGRMDSTIDGTGMEAGAVTAVQSGLATAANLATVDTVVDAVKALQ